MIARTLGSSGLPVTSLGLGLAALGRPAYINLGRDEDLGVDRSVPALRRRTHQVLDAAYEAGMRYFDAARSYGRAEEFLASWLTERHIPAGSITVGSKWGYTYTAGWSLDAEVNEVKDHSLAAFRRQFPETRAALGEHLSLYQVHSATLESGVLEDAEVLSALAELRAEGLVVGLTVSGPRQADMIRRALEVRVDGVNPFATVQATWNVLEPSAGPALAEASQAGFGVILKEVLANGRLTERDVAIPEPLRLLARDVDASLDEFAVAAALGNPWAHTVLSGAVSPAQVHANRAALELDVPPLDDDTLRRWAWPPDRYWSERQALGWS